MEDELRALLLATSAIAARVGTRIDWGVRSQGAPLPSIVLNLVSGFNGMHMNGTGPFEGRVQVDCYGKTYASAKLTARAAVDRLHFYRGGGFLLISHLSTRDTREGGSNEAERPFRTGLDFNIVWRPE